MLEISLLKYGNWLISGLLLAWGVLLKLDVLSEMEADRLYRKWKSKDKI